MNQTLRTQLLLRLETLFVEAGQCLNRERARVLLTEAATLQALLA